MKWPLLIVVVYGASNVLADIEDDDEKALSMLVLGMFVSHLEIESRNLDKSTHNNNF